MPGVKYSIKKNRIKKSLFTGFEMVEEENQIILKTVPSDHYGMFIYPLDSGVEDGLWGRFKFKCQNLEEDAYSVYVAASNELIVQSDESYLQMQKKLSERMEFSQHDNVSDLLLYELKGRYLYILIEVYSYGVPKFSCFDFMVDRIGDNFMQTFPYIYQERNSFFHRYMSVYSSIYNDYDDAIDNFPKLLDLDTCPVELLPIYSSWLGIDLGDDLFEEDKMRTLVKEAYTLNKLKGTKKCLERVSEILLGEKGIVVERNQLSNHFSMEQIKQYDEVYGKSKYDVTLLLRQSLTPVVKSRLEFLLQQFLPVRTRLHIIELNQVNSLDNHFYLDINASLIETAYGYLDNDDQMDDTIILE